MYSDLQGSTGLIASSWGQQYTLGHTGSSRKGRDREPSAPRFLLALCCDPRSLLLFLSFLSFLPTLHSGKISYKAWVCHQVGISQFLFGYNLHCHSFLAGVSGIWRLLLDHVSMCSGSWVSSFLFSSSPNMIF